MSGTSEGGCCANCGKESSDAVKLKNCNACRLVKYCGVDCQKIHRKQHKVECKKRAAELKDERLYGQGHERPEGDFCPICTLPIPLPLENHAVFHACCVKKVCMGCAVAASIRGMDDCPYCRTSVVGDEIAMAQKRVDAKDPAAMKFLGDQYHRGGYGLKRDISRAIELWTEAGELGSIEAHYSIGHSYDSGVGVPQDKTKALRHWEKAAIQGHANSRTSLGVSETNKGNYERAVRHFLIAAKLGDGVALNHIKTLVVDGNANIRHFAEALKGYQESVGEAKSPERDEATRMAARNNRRP